MRQAIAGQVMTKQPTPPIAIFQSVAALKVLPPPGSSLAVRQYHQDYEHARRFLLSYTGSSATFNAYRREMERLCLWAWQVEARSVLELQRDDIERFIEFLIQPPQTWVGTKTVARTLRDGEPNPDWRPFVVSVKKSRAMDGEEARACSYNASQAGLKASFAILSSFYALLLADGVIEANPVAQIRQKSKFVIKSSEAAPVRRLSRLQWEYVLDVAQDLARAEPDKHERTLFILYCLYCMYLRISELVVDARSTPVMGDFRKDMDQNWWFHVTGKGNKSRTIVVSDDMLAALKRYRAHLGLSALPALSENHPLLPKAKGRGGITSTRRLRKIVQDIFDQTYERMQADGLGDDALELRASSAHWLRHTGISEDVKTRPREHVRDDAGHVSMSTTDRYVDTDRRERHASGKFKSVRE